MKLTTVTFFLLLFTQGLNAQQWFETGDVWVQREANGLSGYEGYEEVTVLRDTTIENKAAVILNVYNKGVGVAFGGSQIDRQYQRIVREEGNKIYHWDGEDFDLIYDFNLSVGDTLYVDYDDFDFECGAPIPCTLIDTSSITLGNRSLTVQHFEYYNDFWDEFGEFRIMEKVGMIEGHFEISPSFVCHTDATWYHLCSFTTGQDSMMFLQQPCYDLPLSTDDLEIKGLKLYPNPTDGVIYIESDEVIEMSSIYALDGMLLHRFKPTHSRINLNKFIYKPGIYLIELESRKGNVSKKRIYLR